MRSLAGHMEVDMQKISGILAGSPRVMSVDMKDAPPVRPGTPGFGRPEGVSSLRDRAGAADAVKKANDLQVGMLAARAQEGGQSEVAARLATDFFMKNKHEVAETDALMIMPVAVEMPRAEDALEEVAISRETTSGSVPDPDGLYPKGSFIDRVA